VVNLQAHFQSCFSIHPATYPVGFWDRNGQVLQLTSHVASSFFMHSFNGKQTMMKYQSAVEQCFSTVGPQVVPKQSVC
jgi:hypothetical protein